MMPRYDTTKAQLTYKKGWKTSEASGSRKKMIAGIREWLMDRAGWVDPRCVGELGTFIINKNGKAEAKGGCHDDEVFGFGICIQLDMICPYEEREKEAERAKRERPVREKVFELEEHRTEEDTSHESLCFNTALAQKSINEGA
jgi:hypothetical protein